MKKFTLMLLVAFAFGATSLFAQSRTISGKVIDAGTKEPIVGATIIVQGTQNGAYSLDGGDFIITNVNGAVNLEVSFVGYADKIVPVAASVTKIEIALDATSLKMDDVVVIAYGQADKKSLTGSVSVISSEKMESRPVTDVFSAITGAAAGVQVSAASGAPGSNATIRIRGIGSINTSTTPLYVVDGIPFTGDITAISPDDIATMSILKDAASTALYGSRAANGVIMITTKTGRKDKVSFNVKINEGFTMKAQQEYDKLGPQDFYTTQWMIVNNNALYGGTTSDPAVAARMASDGMIKNNIGYNIYRDKTSKLQIADNQLVTGVLDPTGAYLPKFADNAEVMPGYLGDLDWMENITRLGFRQNYNISASGGSDKATYFGSVGYTDEQGYMHNTSTQRLNGRLKLDVKPTTWLKFGTNLSYSRNIYDNPYSSGSTTYSNPFFFARTMAPVYPVHNHYSATGDYMLDINDNMQYDDGKQIVDENANVIKNSRVQFPAGRNIVWEGSLNKAHTDANSVFGQVYADITFLKDFVFTIDASMNNYMNNYNEFDNTLVGDGAPSGSAFASNSRTFDYNFKQLLNYTRQFGKHNVSVLLGHENYQSKYNYLSGFKTSEILPGNVELDNYSSISSMSGYSTIYRTEGYFARANYNFDNKYFVNGSYRRDGSSKFSPENRWGNFWSVGASWIVSSENFMQNASWVDMLKVRASYGSVGNDAGLGRYQWQGLYVMGNTGISEHPYFRWSTNGNPDVRWETNKSFDVGVDFRLWNRLNGTIEYFDRVSDGLIMSVPQPISSGVSSQSQNIGSMYNRGIEVSLDVDVLRKRDWTWNIGMNATWYKNRVTSIPDDNRAKGIISGTKKIMEGHSYYEYWLIQSGGVDPLDGASLYLWDPIDANGDKRSWTPGKSYREYDGVKYTTMSTQAKYDWSGEALPSLYGAITTSLTWKNLTLDIMFNYKLGGKAIDRSYWGLMSGSSEARSYHKDILTTWQKPGDVSKFPRLQGNSGTANGYTLYTESTRMLTSGSFMTLQNVTLTYKFPKKIVQKLTLAGLSVYASGENLWQTSAIKGFDAASTFTGVQDNSRFSSAAVFTFGINVSF